jgi:hypothetical protein
LTLEFASFEPSSTWNFALAQQIYYRQQLFESMEKNRSSSCATVHSLSAASTGGSFQLPIDETSIMNDIDSDDGEEHPSQDHGGSVANILDSVPAHSPLQQSSITANLDHQSSQMQVQLPHFEAEQIAQDAEFHPQEASAVQQNPIGSLSAMMASGVVSRIGNHGGTGGAGIYHEAVKFNFSI